MLTDRGNVHNVFKKAQNLMRDNLVGPDAAHQCPHCYKTNAIPDFVESFPCGVFAIRWS